MDKPTITVILGSIREGRNGEKVFAWLKRALADFSEAEFDFVDLKDFALPLFADAESPKSRQGKHQNSEVQRWLDLVAEAEAFVFVTPEYNHSVPSGLKNAVDYAFPEWNDKPIGFVSYGGAAGGTRAVEHWRQIIAELHMHTVRDQVSIPFVWSAFDEQGNLQNEEAHKKALDLMMQSIVTLCHKLSV